MPSGAHAKPVPPHILAAVEQILAANNHDGMVPERIADALLADMAVAVRRSARWSCSTLRLHGIHFTCPDCYPAEVPPPQPS